MFQTIMIVDDSSTARMITRRCLEITGYQDSTFLEANDGTQALSVAKQNQVDLMVVDLNMPNMDGRSLLKHLKASPRLNHIPVLIISSLITKAMEKELKEIGAFAALIKPISPANLVNVLKSLTADTTWGL